MEVISLWHCWGGMEAQVSLTVAFSSFAFFVSCFSFSSWQHPIDSLWGSGLLSLLASQAHQHRVHLTNFWCFWQCGQVPNPAGKWNQHLNKAGQQKEEWSAPKCIGKRVQWCWFSFFKKKTMAQHQQMTLYSKSSQTVETGSWCLDSSLSRFLVKFTQILESILLDNPHKAAVLSVGCASFSSTLFPSTQLSVNMFGYSTMWTASFFGN